LLNDVWRDIISITGWVLTIVALWYTIWQVRETKRAADAAKQAAVDAAEEYRRSVVRFSAATAHRFVIEVQGHVDSGEWALAGLRLHDLAQYFGHIAADSPDAGRQDVDDLRRWAQAAAVAQSDASKFSRKRWNAFIRRVQSKIDEYHRPFSEEEPGGPTK
jgi:hypothetical protein